MNTIILFWNPAISSFTLDDMQLMIEGNAHYHMNWSVYEHRKAHYGDRFYMVRCGEGKTGLCMSGFFISEPYLGEDWAGRGRDVHYMDMNVDTAIHPEYMPILPTAHLQSAIPSFDWSGGHSGRLLPNADAEILEHLWKNFLDQNDAMFHYHAYRHK